MTGGDNIAAAAADGGFGAAAVLELLPQLLLQDFYVVNAGVDNLQLKTETMFYIVVDSAFLT